ncbi:UNVERIFIED_CONTAM: hypothetical protein HHA_454750 [Hammondia hammondi]|eukprot:XP_008888360.1 hypothetical protein HHA_454750 [Hammondia hammondi]
MSSMSKEALEGKFAKERKKQAKEEGETEENREEAPSREDALESDAEKARRSA